MTTSVKFVDQAADPPSSLFEEKVAIQKLTKIRKENVRFTVRYSAAKCNLTYTLQFRTGLRTANFAGKRC